MTSPPLPGTESPSEVPLGQRLYDSPFLLLAVGLLVMALVYTGWVLWELWPLPPATLP
jgi:hypothetical protein